MIHDFLTFHTVISTYFKVFSTSHTSTLIRLFSYYFLCILPCVWLNIRLLIDGLFDIAYGYFYIFHVIFDRFCVIFDTFHVIFDIFIILYIESWGTPLISCDSKLRIVLVSMDSLYVGLSWPIYDLPSI